MIIIIIRRLGYSGGWRSPSEPGCQQKRQHSTILDRARRQLYKSVQRRSKMCKWFINQKKISIYIKRRRNISKLDFPNASSHRHDDHLVHSNWDHDSIDRMPSRSIQKEFISPWSSSSSFIFSFHSLWSTGSSSKYCKRSNRERKSKKRALRFLVS